MDRVVTANYLYGVIERLRTGFEGKTFAANPCPFMPESVAKKIIDDIGPCNNSVFYLVLFNVELACELYARGATNVTVATSEFCPITKLVTEKIGYKYSVIKELEDTNMQFDVVASNPPYKGQSLLHQKFFNKAVDLTKEGGVVLFIHPATVYFNKKEETQEQSQLVRDNIKKYQTSVEFINPKVFKSANVFNDLAITKLTKVKSNPELVSVKYSSGKEYVNVRLEDVTKTEIEPSMYAAIVGKYKTYVAEHGSILDIVTKDPAVKKARITSQRGNIGKDDWYTFMSADKKYWVNHGPFGIPAENDEIVANIYDYFTLNFTRFGLAIYKFAGDLHGGAMGCVPIVPFDKKYTDAELYDMIGLTEDERACINNFLPDYYGRYAD